MQAEYDADLYVERMEVRIGELEEKCAQLAVLKAFAGTLAVHVLGHFAHPTDASVAICKDWADRVKALT